MRRNIIVMELLSWLFTIVDSAIVLSSHFPRNAISDEYRGAALMAG